MTKEQLEKANGLSYIINEIDVVICRFNRENSNNSHLVNVQLIFKDTLISKEATFVKNLHAFLKSELERAENELEQL